MTFRILAALLLLGPPLWGQQPPIGIIDIYGLAKVSPDAVRAALGLTVGDSVPAPFEAVVQRLKDIPGVQDASLNPVCCEDGKSILYVGIVEAGAAPVTWNPAPTGKAQLPDSIRALGSAFESALWDGIRQGDAEEDRSAGHSLMHYPPARRIQEQFPAIAAANLGLLRTVLHQSSNAGDRALAAQIIAYATDKQAVVPDLVAAGRDPNETVRNNAIRALAMMTSARPTPIKVPAEPFVALLSSAIWTDRNKASLALMELTNSRDPALLAALRPARDALVEMARWKSPGHATPALVILGRLGGVSDAEISAALARGDRESIIQASQ